MKQPTPPRTGATSRAAIPPQILLQLSRGEIETKTLSEGLAIDFVVLVKACKFNVPFPKAKQNLSFDIGIKERMRRVGAWMFEELGLEGIAEYCDHPSDTVRAWCAYAVAEQADLSLKTLLTQIKPFADDSHFGVREWAWIAVRDRIADEIELALNLFQSWTTQRSTNIRRFAIEATRPRGVWCAHIPMLKEQPEIALPLLTTVNSDPEKYVQDSVANWLNDASKTQPDWVRKVCTEWRETSPTKETERICHGSLRSLS